MSSAAHLVKRFFGSLDPRGPGPEGDVLVSLLNDGERALWARMSGPDRRHAVGVALRLPPAQERWVVAAALLHDVGKVESGLGTFGRVVATLVGRRRARGRMATYLDHPAIGGRLLTRAGSHELTVAWAEDHHKPADRWRVPAAEGTALKSADDD